MSSSVTETAAGVAASSSRPAATRFYPLRVHTVVPETRHAVAVSFEVPDHLRELFQFKQGQFVTVRAHMNGVEVRRSYSICSAVQDGQLRIGIKRAPGGLFSNWIADRVKAGDVVEVMPPDGRFFVPLATLHRKHYVAFAAGSGITPILSIIKTTLLAEPHSGFTLFYGNRSSSTTMFREELCELKDIFLDRLSLHFIMSREPQDSELLSGRITGERAGQLMQHFCDAARVDHAFLCGPHEMADQVSAALQRLGIEESKIKLELFTSDGVPRRNSEARSDIEASQCEATVIVDGTRHSFTVSRDEPILTAALRNGIDLRHSCRSGVCATCRSKLIEGEVEMDANYALEDYEIARGFILTCQSYPMTERVTLDFDQDT